MADDNPYLVPNDTATTVKNIARQSGVPDDVADDYMKVAHIESGQNINVRNSPKGARGFGQVMPDVKGGRIRTVDNQQYDLTDPVQNITAGLKYFHSGGSDPISRRLQYFGGPRARQHYEGTGRIPNISDGNMTAKQYLQATGGFQQQKPSNPYLVPNETPTPAPNDYLVPNESQAAAPTEPSVVDPTGVNGPRFTGVGEPPPVTPVPTEQQDEEGVLRSTTNAPKLPSAQPERQMPEQGAMPGQVHLNSAIAPQVPAGKPRPFAPGEWVDNPDGSWSSEISSTVQNPDGSWSVVPGMWLVNGKPTRVNEDQAATYAQQSGLNFPKYKTLAEAEKFATDRESVWQGVKPQEASKIAPLWAPAPLKFQADQSSPDSFAAQAAVAGINLSRPGMKAPPSTHPALVGKPITAQFDKPPDANTFNDAMAAQIGPAALRANQKYREETGRNLFYPSRDIDQLIHQNPDTGKWEATSSPSQGLYRAINAYNRGGLPEAQAEAKRMHDETVKSAVDMAEPAATGLKQAIRSGAGGAAVSDAQYLYNITTAAKALYTASVYGTDSPEYRKLEKWDQQNQAVLSRAPQAVQQPEGFTNQVVAGLVQGGGELPQIFAAGGNLPVSAYIRHLNEGQVNAGLDAIKMLPVQGAFNVIHHGVGDMPWLKRQVVGRAAGGTVMAGQELAQGETDPRKLAQSFAIGAAFPVGKGGEAEEAPGDIQVREKAALGIDRAQRVPDIEGTLAAREAGVRPPTTPEAVDQRMADAFEAQQAQRRAAEEAARPPAPPTIGRPPAESGAFRHLNDEQLADAAAQLAGRPPKGTSAAKREAREGERQAMLTELARRQGQGPITQPEPPSAGTAQPAGEVPSFSDYVENRPQGGIPFSSLEPGSPDFERLAREYAEKYGSPVHHINRQPRAEDGTVTGPPIEQPSTPSVPAGAPLPEPGMRAGNETEKVAAPKPEGAPTEVARLEKPQEQRAGRVVKFPQAPQWFHATHENLTTLKPREVGSSYNSIGTWLTGDAATARELYGPNVIRASTRPSNLLEAHTENFDDLFYSNEALFRNLFRKEPIETFDRFRERGLRDQRILDMRQQYLAAFRRSLENAGYEGVIWKDSRIDLPKRGAKRHDVTVVFNKEPISTFPTGEAENISRNLQGRQGGPAPTSEVAGRRTEAETTKEPWQMTRKEFANNFFIRGENDSGQQAGFTGKALAAPGHVINWWRSSFPQMFSTKGSNGRLKFYKSSEAREMVPKLIEDALSKDVAGLKPVFEMPATGDTDPHRVLVETALREGKPVPPEVLADYPDLQQPSSNKAVSPTTLTAESALVPETKTAAPPPVETKPSPELSLPPAKPGENATVAAARARLAAKGAPNIADFFKSEKGEFDPQQLVDFLTVHGYDLYQSGKAKFEDWRDAMREKFGEKADPYLKAAWAGIRGTDTIKESLRLPLIEQRAHLNRPFEMTYESESGKQIVRKMTVGERQDQLVKKERMLERLVDCLHA